MLAKLSTDNMKPGVNFRGSYCFWESRFTPRIRLNVAKSRVIGINAELRKVNGRSSSPSDSDHSNFYDRFKSKIDH